MLRINVSGKEYKVRFGYRVLCDTNLMDDVIKTFSGGGEETNVKSILSIVSELLLAGLQKYHSDEFGYEKVGYDEAKKRVYDLMDNYEDESTEDNPQDCYELFGKIQEELFNNGFFKAIQAATTTAEEKKASLKKK